MSKQRRAGSKTSQTNASATESKTPRPAREIERTESTTTSNARDKTAAALRLFFFCFFLFFWGVRYRNFLYVAQEYDLFLWDYGYFCEATERVAGLSRYLSSFLVQFFYFPFVGALILSACLSLIQYGTEKLFRLTGSQIFWSFVPPCLATLQATCVNYFLFERMDVAYIFSPIFNCAFALTFALIYNSISTLRKRVAFFVVGHALAYPVFGFWASLSCLFCVLRETELSKDAFAARKTSGKRALVDVKSTSELCELLILYALLVPGVYWFFFADTTPGFRYMYIAGLREESVLSQGREFSTNVLWIFYQTASILFLVVFSLANALRNKIKFFRQNPGQASLSKGRFQKYASPVPVVLCVLICAATCRFSYSSSNFQTLLKTARLLDSQNWDAILEAESKIQTPINPLILARMTALTRTNQLGDKLFTRPLVAKVSPQLETVNSFGMCGDRVLYESGAVNLGTRTASNNYVVKRARSVWALKTLTLCALADRRTPLAERYLYRLQQTLFHRRFANEASACLEKNAALSSPFASYLTPPSNADVKRAEKLEESLETVRRLEPLEDDLASSGNINAIYYRQIQQDDLSKREPDDRENELAILLVMRNFPRFGLFFDAYLQEKGNAPLPRCLQEAALFRERFPALFEAPENQKSPREIKTTNVDPEIRKRFERFLTLLNTPGSEDVIDARLRREFGDTFWYYVGSKQATESY